MSLQGPWQLLNELPSEVNGCTAQVLNDKLWVVDDGVADGMVSFFPHSALRGYFCNS